MALKQASTGPLPRAQDFDLCLVLKDNFSVRRLARFTVLVQGDEVENVLGGLGTFHLHQGQDVFVKNLALAVGQLFESWQRRC